MNVQIQPNRYTCMITALAMCIDRPVKELIELAGHDGSDVLAGYPRGFHSQELIDLGLKLGYALVTHYPYSIHQDDKGNDVAVPCTALLEVTDQYRPGILLLAKKDSKNNHGVAVDEEGEWIDPTTGCKVYWPDATLLLYMSVHRIA